MGNVSSTFKKSRATRISPSSPFESLLNATLHDYAKQTGKKLEHHFLTKKLKKCDSADSITSVLQDHQEHAKAFRKFRGDHGKIMRPMKRAVHVLFTLSSSTALGEAVALPLPPGKAIFAAFGILLGAVKDVNASYDALVELFESIERFLGRLEIYTKITLSEAMKDIIVKIMVEVISTLALATKQVKQGPLRKFMKKLLGENEIEVVLQRLERLTQDEARATGAQTLEVLYNLVKHRRLASGMDDLDDKMLAESVRMALEDLQRMSSEINKSKRDKFLQNIQTWLSPPDPWKNHNIARDSQHRGTATWWIDSKTYLKWKHSGPSSLLWIHGKPGSGKSVLCSSIIQDIRFMCVAGLASLAFFYCDFREDQKKERRGLLTSLLTQLCNQSDAYCAVLSDLYSANGRGSQHASDSELQQCLLRMLKLPEQAPAYIVIDGLDECPVTSGLPSPREGALDIVEVLVDLQYPNLRICVTSRPEVDIEPVLRPLAFHSISLHNESGQLRDIADYVKFKVRNDPKTRKWREEDKEHVINVLTEKADGMFQWVYCQLEYLRLCLPSRVRHTLDDLPKTLDATYERTLKDIGKVNWEHAQRLFQCVGAASRPLRAEELAEFLAFDFNSESGLAPRLQEDWRSEDPVQAVLSTCSSLLAVVDVDGSAIIQFSHFSAKEYLTSKRLADTPDPISQFHVSMAPAHTIIAQSCLGVLLHIDDNITEDDLERFPLAKYAAEYWVAHARFEDVFSTIRDELKRLFDPNNHHLAVWVWIYDPASPRRRLDGSKSPSQSTAHALHYATICGLHSIVDSLIAEHSQDVNVQSFDRNETPLAIACRFGHIEAARVLLERGADTTIRDKEYWSPLERASENGHVEVIRVLLRHGADVTAQDNTGTTPLHTSSAYGQPESARVLLEHGANVHARGMDGVTPLHWASNELVARVLLDHGADPNAEDDYKRTPLREAKVKQRPKVESLLLERGAKEADTTAHMTQLHMASTNGQMEDVLALLQTEVDANAKGNNDETPLHCALNGGVTQILLDHGADPNSKDRYNRTPLHEAVVKRRLEVVHELLDKEADPNLVDVESRTPLHLASEAGYLDGVRLLLQRSADVHARDCWSLTPFAVASANQRKEIMELLLEYGAEDHRTY